MSKNPSQLNSEGLQETLRQAVDAESMMHFCAEHLCRVIHNGKVRRRFAEFSGVAKANKELLVKHAQELGMSSFLPDEKCRYCDARPDNFSLFGALSLCLEITNILVKLYKKLGVLSHNTGEGMIYKEIAEERSLQAEYLKSEIRFADRDIEEKSFIDSYCMPEIISRLWK